MKPKIKYKVEVFLTKDNKDRLKSKADALGSSMADIIKRALEIYLN